MRYLIDSDVVADYLKGHDSARILLEPLFPDGLASGSARCGIAWQTTTARTAHRSAGSLHRRDSATPRSYSGDTQPPTLRADSRSPAVRQCLSRLPVGKDSITAPAASVRSLLHSAARLRIRSASPSRRYAPTTGERSPIRPPIHSRSDRVPVFPVSRPL